MVIKNFLFLVIFSFIFSGCESIERRQHAGESPQSPQTAQSRSGTPNTPNVGATPVPTTTLAAPPRITPVGIFLGPGAMRSFAHVGILRALQRAQVPIVAIGGMEWGSVVAASYALSGKSNEVEWEMLKLKSDQIPTTNLLRRELIASEPQQLAPFLKAAFGERELDRGQIPFRCPYTDGDQTFFISRGTAREQILRCVVLPPLFSSFESPGKSWISGAINPGDWAGEMRRAGAQYIIYVDVISRGIFIQSGAKYSNPSSVKALWGAVKTLSKEQHAFANFTIEVPMDLDLSDFDHRHEAITAGEEAAKNSVNQILKAIGVLQ